MFVAGLVLGATPASAAERLRFALEREGGACPPAPAADAPPAEQAGWTLGLIRLNGKLPEGSNLAGCVLHLRLEGLSDDQLASAAATLSTAHGAPALILEIPTDEIERTVYAVKRLSSSFRGASG